MSTRIGILTGGGDCPGLNGVIRAVTLHARQTYGWEVGGDGSMSFANKFIQRGATRIVGVPKTIDNDLEATDYTVGFQTAVEVVVEALERLHTTAESHERIMIV